MTWLGLLNFAVLQWFGVRLARVRLPPGVVRFRAARDLRAGQLVTTADVFGPSSLDQWKLLRWVWPLTGWWSSYRWIARRS